jgi:hypothetical protein
MLAPQEVSVASKRRGLGGSYAEKLFSDCAPRARTREDPPAETEKRPTAKLRATFHISAELFDECRNAVVALSGPPLRLTLAGLAESALRRELDRLKAKHHDGKPFPTRAAPLKGGRPIRTVD